MSDREPRSSRSQAIERAKETASEVVSRVDKDALAREIGAQWYKEPRPKTWREALSSRTLWLVVGFALLCLVGVWAEALTFPEALDHIIVGIGAYSAKSGLEKVGNGLRR